MAYTLEFQVRSILTFRSTSLLGILGFVSLKDLAGADAAYTANCGLLDQIAALEWVREHIAAFGGDPDQVTVMGESAGAMSIGALLGMPAAHGLFQRAILQSGAAGNLTKRPQAAQVAQALLAKLGLETSQLSALAEVPVETLLKVQPELGREFGGVQAYSPIIDGETLPQHPSAMIAQGSTAHMAILAGTNRDEWRLFAMMSGWPKVDEELLTQIFGDQAKTALSTYTEARTDTSKDAAWIDIMSDVVFRMPAIRLAEGQVRQGTPVWMYRFDWESPAFGGILGAAHAMDIPFVWNTLDTPLSRMFTGDSPTRRPLADLMHAAWAAFIRSGTPTIDDLPAWPPYELDKRATMIFSDAPHVVDDPQGQVRELWEHVLQEREGRAWAVENMAGATVLSQVAMHQRSHMNRIQFTGEWWIKREVERFLQWLVVVLRTLRAWLAHSSPEYLLTYHAFYQEVPETLCFDSDVLTPPINASPAAENPQAVSFAPNRSPNIAHLGHADTVLWHIPFWHVL